MRDRRLRFHQPIAPVSSPLDYLVLSFFFSIFISFYIVTSKSDAHYAISGDFDFGQFGQHGVVQHIVGRRVLGQSRAGVHACVAII